MITPVIILSLLVLPLIGEVLMARMQRRCMRLEIALVNGLVLAFLFFALGHFVKTEGMMAMLPDWVTDKRILIYLSGIWEIVIAAGLIWNCSRRLALISACATLVIFFPANIYAALNYTGLGGHQWGPVYLWIRGPLQLILIACCAWIYRVEQKNPPGRQPRLKQAG